MSKIIQLCFSVLPLATFLIAPSFAHANNTDRSTFAYITYAHPRQEADFLKDWDVSFCEDSECNNYCDDGLYLYDPAYKVKLDYLLGGARPCSLTPPLIQPKRPNGKPDYHRYFVPYANSKVAISKDGRYVAVSSRVINRNLESVREEAHKVDKNHYRILLVNLDKLEADDPLTQEQAVQNIFDTQNYLKFTKPNASGQYEIARLDESLPFGLEQQFTTNAAVNDANPRAETFMWGKSPRIKLKFSDDGTKLYFRVLTDDYYEEMTWFGNKHTKQTLPGKRKDLGVDRSFYLDISKVEQMDWHPAEERAIRNMYSYVQIYRTVIPNETYIDKNNLFGERDDIVAFATTEDRRAIAISRLSKQEATSYGRPIYTHSLVVKQNCLAIPNPPETCRSEPQPMTVRTVRDYFYPFVQWFDDRLAYSVDRQDVHVMDAKQLRRRFLANAKALDFGDDPTPEQARQSNQASLQPLNAPVYFQTDNPGLRFHGLLVDGSRPPTERRDPRNNIDNRSNYLRLGPPGQIYIRGDRLVAEDKSTSFGRATAKLRSTSVKKRYLPEWSEHDRHAGFPLVYDMSRDDNGKPRNRVQYGVYPLFKARGEVASLWELITHYRLHESSETTRKGPWWTFREFFTASVTGFQSSTPNIHLIHYSRAWLSGSFRRYYVDPGERYLYFLEFRQDNRYANTDYHRDLRNIGEGAFISRIPFDHPVESNIERLTKFGWVPWKQLRPHAARGHGSEVRPVSAVIDYAVYEAP